MNPIGTLFLRGARFIPFPLFLAAWQTVAKSGLVDPAFFPSVGAIGHALADLGASKSFYSELAVTFGRSLGGLALGAIIGVPIGTGMAVSHRLEGFFGPL